LLCEQFDARIVISSTWRYSHSIDELREFFADNNINPELVIGVTPDLVYEEQPQSFCRGDEIRRWLEENEYHTYVIIDDLPASEFLKEQKPHLVVVKQDKGFSVKEAAVRAGEILEKGDL
jgi:stringent starvation protein B